MPIEIKKEIQLEIAHVLFIDIVGYSKLLIDEQRDYSHTLNEVVRETDSFRAAEVAGKLTRCLLAMEWRWFLRPRRTHRFPVRCK
jgi:hypothetical protein